MYLIFECHDRHLMMKIQLVLGEKNIDASIVMKLEHSFPSFLYYDQDNDPLITDKLSYFQSIDVDDNNPLLVTMVGNGTDRVILFDNPTDMSLFWSFVQKHAKVNPLPGEHRTFILEHEKPAQYSIKNLVPQAITSIVSSTYHEIKSYITSDTADHSDDSMEEDVEEDINADGIKMGYLTPSLPVDFKLKNIY